MSRVVLIHRKRVEQVEAESLALAGCFHKIALSCREVLEISGQIHVEAQMAFAVGAFARLMKDVGVIEQLQSDGVAQRRRMDNGGTKR